MRLKLLALLLLVIGFWFLVKTPIINAQSPTPNPSISPGAEQNQKSANYLNTNPDVPYNLHTYSQSVFIELAAATSCLLTGIDPINPYAKCLGIDPTTNKIGYVENSGGVISVMGSMISYTFHFPINTHQYGAYLASNFGITQPIYAQQTGLGYNALLPTLEIWKAFRNITYMIFTFIFVIIGIGIMFRIKVDPRTAMTIQNQIPRIIIALVFITFSYAIAGFLVDLMYVSIYLVIAVFAQNGFDTSSAVASTPFGAAGGLGGMHDITYGVSSSISGIVADFFSGSLGNIVGAMIGGIIGSLIPSPGPTLGSIPVVSTIVGGVTGLLFGSKTVGLFAGVITYLIVMIAIISALFRLWFVLIKSYLYVFLTVVFGPFYIATGALPGRSGIGSWVRGMIANLAVFPATIVMFLLGKAFITSFSTPDGENIRPFLPPLIGDFVNPDRMAAIIGLAIILLTPEIANMVKEALKVADLKQGSAIGKGLATGARGLSAPVGMAWNRFLDRNKQTGAVQGPTAIKVLGRHPLTRWLFKIPHPQGRNNPNNRQRNAGAAMMRGAIARRGPGATPPPGTPGGPGATPPPGTPGGPGPTPPPGTPGGPGATPPPGTPGGPGAPVTGRPADGTGGPVGRGRGAPPVRESWSDMTEEERAARDTEEERARASSRIAHSSSEPVMPSPEEETPIENRSSGGGENKETDNSVQEEILKRLAELTRLQREQGGANKDIEAEMGELNERLKKLS